MNALGNLFFNLLILGAIVVFLASCASADPSAEPPACRGTAFSINAPSTQAASAP